MADKQNNEETTVLMINTSEHNRNETENNSTEGEILATEDREEIEIQQITITS